MIAELIGAKLLSPYFGSSLYVWSSVMAITLGGLAAGYFIGGIWSTKKDPLQRLMMILALSGISLISMPFLARFIFPYAFTLKLLPGVVLGTITTLFFPVFFMGSVSPLVIKILNVETLSSGKTAGEVYGVSTIGGIIATFLTGFWLIPEFGLTIPLVFVGTIILLIPCIYQFYAKNYFTFFIFILTSTALILMSFYEYRNDKPVVFKSEGILGRVEVLEIPVQNQKKKTLERSLLINNIIQTSIDLSDHKSTIDYVDILKKNLDRFEFKNKKALLLGLGGGAVANVLVENGWDVTAIEIDERIVDVAKEYFFLSPKVKIITDDARHGLFQAGNQFDFVLFDMYSAEVAPSHVVSVEALKEIEEICDKEVLFVFNTYGYLNPKAGMGNLSLLKTLRHLNYQNKISVHGDVNYEDYRGFLIFSKKTNFKSDFKLFQEFEIKDDSMLGTLITDNFPVLEYQNALAAKKWRFEYIQNFISKR